ncbi:hypothetical protein [Flavobacterium sp. FlaQc-47]|uniref:hypothetical protein n=1 Tax=Flavobacterium sp. FlaQc-47 TaxID=3374180 RepID=UPI003757EDC7
MKKKASISSFSVFAKVSFFKEVSIGLLFLHDAKEIIIINKKTSLKNVAFNWGAAIIISLLLHKVLHYKDANETNILLYSIKMNRYIIPII